MILSVNIAGLIMTAFLFYRLQAMPVNANPSPCNPECQIGYECNTATGSCEQINCEECNNVPTEPVCGYDSITYINACELRKSNCLKNQSTEIKHNGTCQKCNQLRDDLEENKQELSRAEKTRLINLCNNEEVTIEELMSYRYTPECSREDESLFSPKQFNEYCRLYWCVTSDGDPIDGKISRSSSALDCTGRSCIVSDSISYNHGDIISTDCGYSKCLNGEITTFSDYCLDEDGNLSDDQLLVLKSDVLYLFHYQYQVQDKMAKFQLPFIRNNIPDMSTSLVDTFLNWKFLYYDLNGDRVLYEYELKNFFQEVYDLVQTKTFRDPLLNALNLDGNHAVSWDEWYIFFSLDQGSSGGSLPVASGSASSIEGK